MFREAEPPTGGGSDRDFTNLVMFCIKSNAPFSFRRPIEADFLGTASRRQNLMPKYEVNLKHFENKIGDEQILTKKTKGTLERWHRDSAVGHWHIMRTVLPDVVWESW